MAVALRPPMVSNQSGPPVIPFERATRMMLNTQAAIPRPVGGGPSPTFQIPANSLLAGLYLEIRGAIGGTVGAVSPLGFASIVKRVTVKLGSGTVLFSMTGPNYHYLFRDYLDAYQNCLVQTNARTAITAIPTILDMVIPFQVNERDNIGLLMLQNRQMNLYLDVEWEADAVVTATGTFTGFSVIPHLLVFSVPPDPRSLPELQYLRVMVDEQRVIAGAGDVTYDIPRANQYLRIIHGAGINASPADSWSASKLRVNQTQYIWNATPNNADIMFNYQHGRARNLGAIAFDFLGTSGLGSYGTPRDVYDSNKVTDLQTVTTVTGALTFYTVRDMLLDLDKA